jgi:two-component system response regulator AtoC
MTGAAAEPRDFSPMPKKCPSIRVLVVDDEPLIRWSVAETLLDLGYDVSEAVNGETALEVMSAQAPFHVAVLDYRLPDSNDLKLLAAVRRLSPWTQVILMTAFGTPEAITGAQQLGVYRVVHKPFEMTDISDLVQQAYASRFICSG